jgi:hypothetical protein
VIILKPFLLCTKNRQLSSKTKLGGPPLVGFHRGYVINGSSGTWTTVARIIRYFYKIGSNKVPLTPRQDKSPSIVCSITWCARTDGQVGSCNKKLQIKIYYRGEIIGSRSDIRQTKGNNQSVPHSRTI